MATRTRDKGAAREQTRDKRPQAHAKHIRLSSRKAKIVLDLIRGKDVDQALAILTFTPKAASPVIAKVLSSAIANAVNNQDLDRSTLYVAECYANPRPDPQALRSPQPRQRFPHAQAHLPHQRGARPEEVKGGLRWVRK